MSTEARNWGGLLDTNLNYLQSELSAEDALFLSALTAKVILKPDVKLLTQEEVDELEKLKTKEEKLLKLLSTLQKKGPGSLKGFLEALEDCRRRNVADELRKQQSEATARSSWSDGEQAGGKDSSELNILEAFAGERNERPPSSDDSVVPFHNPVHQPLGTYDMVSNSMHSVLQN
eukprot:m.198511 g.198511  ORF g.198511 m.198511 type:complete len:175 (+) comp39561_c0_seq26:70-594(+)